jgi:sirohydrochlorin cobaltochelatase
VSAPPALVLVGHGTATAEGVQQCRALARAVASRGAPGPVGLGFIEFAQPPLGVALDQAVAEGASHVVAVPLVLLGAGHMKLDGPDALAAARLRHPEVRFSYGRPLGIHPLVLDVATDRAAAALGRLGGPSGDAMVALVGRGSTDPDANSDLYKVARLLSDSRGLGPVEPAFVSLAPPGVPEVLERCRRLGARRVAVVPYFLFSGRLADRIDDQARAWAEANPEVEVEVGSVMGPDPRLAQLALERFEEAAGGRAAMNCDCCVYRVPLPGYEERAGGP